MTQESEFAEKYQFEYCKQLSASAFQNLWKWRQFNMTRQDFFDSFDAYRSRDRTKQDEEKSKDFVQVYTSGKNIGKRVKGIVFSILLYPQNENHIKALNRLFDLGYNIACVLHDSDFVDENAQSKDDVDSAQSMEDSESALSINVVSDDMDDSSLSDSIPVSEDNPKLKKAHIHVVGTVQNPRTNTGLAKELGIPSRLVRIVNGLNVRLAYLIHRDNKDKFQYSPDRVCGPLSSRMPTVLKSVDGYLPSLALDLCKYIESKVDGITWSDVLKYANKYGYNDVLYNSKSSYYQSIRQAYYDQQKKVHYERSLRDYQANLAKITDRFSLIENTMFSLCEYLDFPLLRAMKTSGDFNLLGDVILDNKNNIKKGDI